MRINPRIAVRLMIIGFLTGAVSGFFGIGGGFLIVPGIMLGSGMAVLNAAGSLLFSVGVFDLTTANNYAISGFVHWRLAVYLSRAVPPADCSGYWGTRVTARKRALD